eukprot:jgi/Galph1/1955/GphlegSOOS_G639.1
MTSVYSLRLLLHDAAREWLLAREEPKLPRNFMDSSLALRHRVFLGSKLKFVDQLFKPVGIVNGVLIGYSLANYHLVLPADWVPSVETVCRRFALDLNSNEFLELHWFQNNTVMTSWLKFASSNLRIRYFVLYEAPAHGKLPSKLLKSIELVVQRVPENLSRDDEEAKTLTQLADPNIHVLSLAQERLLSIIPKTRVKAKRHLGIFYGTARKTVYKDMAVLDDCFLPYRQCTHVLRESNEDTYGFIKDEEHSNFKEEPIFQRNIKLPLINIKDGSMMIREFLAIERQIGNENNTKHEVVSYYIDPFERRQRRRYILSVKKAHKESNSSSKERKKEDTTVMQAAKLLSQSVFATNTNHGTSRTFSSHQDHQDDKRDQQYCSVVDNNDVEHLQVGLDADGVSYSVPASDKSSDCGTSKEAAHFDAGLDAETDPSLQWLNFDPLETTRSQRKDSEHDNTQMKEADRHVFTGKKRPRENEDDTFDSLSWKSEWEEREMSINDDFLQTLNEYLFSLENESGDCFRVTGPREDELQSFLERNFV